MTAIHGYIRPSRRPGELGVHSVDHFHFAVPDLSVAQNFYGEFGLDVGRRGDLLTLGTLAQPMSGERSAKRRGRGSAMSRSALSRTTSSGFRSACRTWASS